MTWTFDIVAWWSTLTPSAHLVAVLLSASIGAASMYLWASRALQRERMAHGAYLSLATAEHGRQVKRLERHTAERIAQLEENLEQLRSQHKARVDELEERLEHQTLFDPHRWVSAATKLRKQSRDVPAIETLRAGVQRTRDALCETYLELALHHFTLHAGESDDNAAAHLHEAQRYTQLAGLLKPNDTLALLLLEDVHAAMESQQIRGATAERHGPSQVGIEGDTEKFLGVPGEGASLALKLADEATARERAGRFVVAERFAYRARAIALHELGEQSDTTTAIRHVYARALVGTGAYMQALQEVEDALRVPEEMSGADNEHAIALRTLRAEILGRLGQWERSLTDLEALQSLSERTKGAEHHDTLELQRQHALTLNAIGRVEAALEEIDATLQVLDRIGEPEEPAITCAHAARAEILNELGRSDEALDELESLLPVAERVFGVEHCNALSIRSQLALVLHTLGRHEEALDDIEMLLSVRQQLCGTNHPLVLQTASLRARILRALDRKQEALLEAQRLLPLHLRVFGDGHRETVGLTRFMQEAAVNE